MGIPRFPKNPHLSGGQRGVGAKAATPRRYQVLSFYQYVRTLKALLILQNPSGAQG